MFMYILGGAELLRFKTGRISSESRNRELCAQI